MTSLSRPESIVVSQDPPNIFIGGLLMLTVLYLVPAIFQSFVKMESSPDEIVIAVMGVTGSGKSSFIRTVTNNKAVHVGHGLESATSEVQSYRFTHKRKRYVLVDTPGFNDHSASDEEIMNRVLEWLETSFRSGTRLNGLIYIHRIIDPKMQGSALANMRMFRQLCGPSCFQNVILATTFWDDVAIELGDRREQELKTSPEFWASMVKKGSQVVRLSKERGAGLKLLEMIAKKEKITLKSQDEMVNENRSHQNTAAAQAMNEELFKQKQELEVKLAQQKRENEKKLEHQKLLKIQQLAREKERQKRLEEEKARQEALRKAAEERRWKAEYEAKQRHLRAEREEQARLKRQEEKLLERLREEAEAARKQREQRLRDERAAYYRNYSCTAAWHNYRSVTCDKCYETITQGYYFHCCFCHGDNYEQCESCGGCCPVYEHPYMQKRWQAYKPDDGCVVM